MNKLFSTVISDHSSDLSATPRWKEVGGGGGGGFFRNNTETTVRSFFEVVQTRAQLSRRMT